uniref:Uncharacterized protein n=1 Tax=Trichobilharzia regenti TaxID=157069 RepID=A0AA85JWK1_TRIRE|nr:unnamed protein product [Trichobilharzia regenti]
MSDSEQNDKQGSPEVPRLTLLNENASNTLQSLYQFVASPDIKNSTVIVSDGVNIKELTQLNISPIYSPCFDSPLILHGDSNTFGITHQSSPKTANDGTSRKLLKKSELIGNISKIAESESFIVIEYSLNKCKDISKRKKGTGKKRQLSDSENEESQNLLQKTKSFMKTHHSCLDTPPEHWTSAPIALTPKHKLASSSYKILGEDSPPASPMCSPGPSSSMLHVPKYDMKQTDNTEPATTSNRSDDVTEIKDSGDTAKAIEARIKDMGKRISGDKI